MTVNPMDAIARQRGADAHRDGKPFSDNPYFTWTPRGGTRGCTLSDMWAAGWNGQAGRNHLTPLTPAEFATVDERAQAERAAYEAQRDPAAAKRTAGRKARKRRARERARAAKAGAA